MNIVLALSAVVLIVVALEVLSAMRLGVTCWVHYPVWIGIAVAAFALLVLPVPAGALAWPAITLVAAMAGLVWRMRHRLVWEVSTAADATSNHPASGAH